MDAGLKIMGLALFIFGSVQSAELPVDKCTLTDKACMIPAVQKMVPLFTAGMPQYGVEVLDPMTNLEMKYDLSGLQFSLSGGTWKGLKNVVINDVEWDTKNKVFSIAFNGDMSVEGHYTAAGKVFDRPITGDGQMDLKMENIHIKLIFNFDMDNGHVKLNKYSFEFDVKDNAKFHFTNLYNGNKAQSDDMLNFLNENWKKIFAGFGHPLIETVAKKVYKNVDNLLEKVAIADIANV